MKDLSILIPSRNEMFLKNTVEDALMNSEADTEVIVVLDGEWASPPLLQHERLNVIFVPDSIGQRSATNLACRLSKARYVMKVDAHCSFDKGFDRKMIEMFKETGDNVTAVPMMNNLHAFSWNCRDCNWKLYQGPTPPKCGRCGGKNLRKKMIWKSKHGVHSSSYCFDSEPHFQYFAEFKRRPEYVKDKAEKGITETMSLQGSCFMLTREKYWELEICGEDIGSWGNQGIETALKTWLSGGRVLVNHKTWYAHMFRTQGGDFSFPYDQSGRGVLRTKQRVKDLFWNKKWPKAVRPLSWLIEKFSPVPGWSDADLKKLKENESLKT